MASGRTAFTSSGVISGSGLAMAKMIGALRHRLDHLLRHRAFDGQAQEHIATLQRVFQRARFGFDRVRGLPLVHAVRCGRDRSRPWCRTGSRCRCGRPIDFEQFEAGDARRARAVHHHFDVARSCGPSDAAH